MLSIVQQPPTAGRGDVPVENMSEDNEEVDKSTCCASCGIAGIDDVKLKECDGCDLVKYCSDECQRSHKSEHEDACKQRAAELRDELLFKQPKSSHLGDCPLCCLPLPLDMKKSTIYGCCSKVICNGCSYANKIREYERRLQYSCPFCREPSPETDEECFKRMMKRIEANDPVAISQEGTGQRKKGEYRKAFEYFTKAAELGDAEAHYCLSIMYRLGHGIERHEGKMMYHREEAVIAGHPFARHDLGCKEKEDGNDERAVKHWIIAASQGDGDSIKELMEAYKDGLISKDDLAATLRAHQAAVDATKSPQREAAEEYHRSKYSAS